MKRTIFYNADGSTVLVEVVDESRFSIEIPESVEQEEVDDDKEWKQYQKNLKTGKPVIGKVRSNKLNEEQI